jgi:AraC family transcriptional regulator
MTKNSVERPCDLYFLAQLVGISPSRFANLFRNSFSRPAHRYVVNRRIERAMCLLSTEGYRNADIAAACGFASESHFSYVFKRITGAIPQNYRQAQRYLCTEDFE